MRKKKLTFEEFEKEQREINATLFTLFNGGLGVEDKGELRAKINKAHDRITETDQRVNDLEFGVIASGLFFSAIFVVVFVILGQVVS